MHFYSGPPMHILSGVDSLAMLDRAAPQIGTCEASVHVSFLKNDTSAGMRP
jgi:hypothetical protein